MNIFVIAKVQNIHYVKQKMQKKKTKYKLKHSFIAYVWCL